VKHLPLHFAFDFPFADLNEKQFPDTRQRSIQSSNKIIQIAIVTKYLQVCRARSYTPIL
jgi:hypothetical protein